MPGPLDGVKVLEFSEIIAGPFGGMLLSDMGADVIKVEPPWGEPWRFAREFIPNESRTYISVNRGKRSLPLDLTRPEGRKIVYELVPMTDVVVVNARPDVPRKLGIDYEVLAAINPGLIYCDITAFGRKGPQRHLPGYDIITQAVTGLMASEGKVRDGVPQQIQSTPVADFSTGIAAAGAICAALYHRERTGVGQQIEMSLLGTALGVQSGRFLQVSVVDDERLADFKDTIGKLRERGSTYDELQEQYRNKLSFIRVNNTYYRTYQARDGVLAVGCLSDPLRRKLLNVLGLEDVRFQPGYDPLSEESEASDNELTKRAETIFRERSVDDWLALLDEAGVPAGPVRFVEELLDDEHVIANNLVVEMEHSLVGKLKMVGPIVKMSETPVEAKRASPALGEHSAEILTDLGYSAEEVQRLKDTGVTG